MTLASKQLLQVPSKRYWTNDYKGPGGKDSVGIPWIVILLVGVDLNPTSRNILASTVRPSIQQPKENLRVTTRNMTSNMVTEEDESHPS